MARTITDSGDTVDVETELERVEQWRARCLLEAGYPADSVNQLAARPDIDLHEACALLADGCDPLVALDILI